MAIHLGSTSSGMDFGAATPNIQNLDKFTMAIVVRPPMTLDSFDRFFTYRDGVSGEGFFLATIFVSKIWCKVQDSASAVFSEYVSAVTDQTIENRVVVTVDVSGKVIDFYVNSSSPVACTGQDNGNPTDAGAPSVNLVVGAGNSPGEASISLSEAAIWDRILPQSVCGQISAGRMSPAFFKDLGGVFYSKLNSVNDAKDEWGGRHGIPAGTVTNETHPQIIYPISPLRGFVAPAAGGSIPIFMHHYKQMAASA